MLCVNCRQARKPHLRPCAVKNSNFAGKTGVLSIYSTILHQAAKSSPKEWGGERAGDMERRAASHTEEEELNQRRRLLNSARKGDPKAITKLFELYQVRVYSGELLSKPSRIPAWPTAHQKDAKSHAKPKASVRKKVTQRSARSTQRAATSKARPRRKVAHR